LSRFQNSHEIAKKSRHLVAILVGFRKWQPKSLQNPDKAEFLSNGISRCPTSSNLPDQARFRKLLQVTLRLAGIDSQMFRILSRSY
jgi:hypothetical protein